MKTYRQREKQGTKVTDTNKGPDEAKIKVRVNPPPFFFFYTQATCEFKKKTTVFDDRVTSELNLSFFFLLRCFDEQALLERTGYTLDVTTGQRKYGGPPPESVHSGTQPPIGTEVRIRIIKKSKVSTFCRRRSNFQRSPNDDTPILCSNQLR